MSVRLRYRRGSFTCEEQFRSKQAARLRMEELKKLSGTCREFELVDMKDASKPDGEARDSSANILEFPVRKSGDTTPPDAA